MFEFSGIVRDVLDIGIGAVAAGVAYFAVRGFNRFDDLIPIQYDLVKDAALDLAEGIVEKRFPEYEKLTGIAIDELKDGISEEEMKLITNALLEVARREVILKKGAK